MAKGRSPSQVVEYGVKQPSRVTDTYDELWCVLDVDQFSDLHKAAALARKSSIPTKLVVSNPCFELWLLLHFCDHRKPVDRYADVKPLLSRHVPDYEKNALRFSAHWPLIGDAVGRAQKLDPTGTDTAANPSTNMWLLVEAVGWRRYAD
jgi:RloB-like protein